MASCDETADIATADGLVTIEPIRTSIRGVTAFVTRLDGQPYVSISGKRIEVKKAHWVFIAKLRGRTGERGGGISIAERKAVLCLAP